MTCIHVQLVTIVSTDWTKLAGLYMYTYKHRTPRLEQSKHYIVYKTANCSEQSLCIQFCFSAVTTENQARLQATEKDKSNHLLLTVLYCSYSSLLAFSKYIKIFVVRVSVCPCVMGVHLKSLDLEQKIKAAASLGHWQLEAMARMAPGAGRTTSEFTRTR